MASDPRGANVIAVDATSLYWTSDVANAVIKMAK
jgi:hypothetical protein